MDATYALGKDIIKRGDTNQFDETRRQFERLARIDSNYKDVKEFLSGTTSWTSPDISKKINQRNLDVVASRLQNYRSALGGTQQINPSDIQTNIINPIAFIQKLPKEQQPDGAERVSAEAQQLLERVSKDLPAVKLKFAVAWKDFPPDTKFALQAGFPVSAIVSHGGETYRLTFTTEDEALFVYGQKSQVVNAILHRTGGDPLIIKLSPNTQWKIDNAYDYCKGLDLEVLSNQAHEPFQTSKTFGSLDEHGVPDRRALINVCHYVTVADNTPQDGAQEAK